MFPRDDPNIYTNKIMGTAGCTYKSLHSHTRIHSHDKYKQRKGGDQFESLGYERSSGRVSGRSRGQGMKGR